MLNNRSIPPTTVIPELAYADVGEAADWLCKAFGFTENLRIANHRAQLNVGDGAIVVTELHGESVDFAHSVMVRVEDAYAITREPASTAHASSANRRTTHTESANTPPQTSAATCGGSRNRSRTSIPRSGYSREIGCVRWESEPPG